MKNTTLNFIVLFFVTINSIAQPNSKNILLKIYNNLDSLNGFNCICTYKFSNPGSDTMVMTSSNMYLKNSKDTIVGYSFILKSENGDRSIYDGINLITLRNDFNDYFLDNIQKDARHLSSMFCSPVSIKKLIKLCLSTDTVPYTLIKDKYGDYQLTLSFPYMFLDGYVFDKMLMPNGPNTKFTILFDKKTFLPKYYLKENLNPVYGNQSFIAYFDNFKIVEMQDIVAIDSIPENFHLYNSEKLEKSVINKQAFNFKLKQLNGDSIELHKIKNRYILLEFSTLGCGACRRATPFLINLKDSLNNKAFDLFVIDTEKHSNTVELSKYVDKEKINYSYLLNGLNISYKYEISAFPTFILIDKDKNIVEMIIGFREERLRKMIGKIN